MVNREYLVGYGKSGDFGRFRPVSDSSYRRGDRVVVRSHQGLELGSVLCAANEEHGRFLSRTALGEILRLVAAEDEKDWSRVSEIAERIFDDARNLAQDLKLPMEILDVEVLLDGRQAVIHYVRSTDADHRALVSTLSRKFDVFVVMQNMSMPAEPEAEESGYDRPDCGKKEGGGGCGTCGSGSGGCGTCGKGNQPDDVAAHLLGLREQMEAQSRFRASLL